ncbi:Glycosyltransferase family 1 protein [Sulfidibacter corallicola]|uniref:Glycosyltransferase family 1 protein n=1 Tax=Sulfidibacter corallicola TaxID=2818388 RepID=A0A8A4U3V5_SULCO|nr:glycosyltransferase [Sulfidibacter corallicola]QTD53425.1 glycosyltransferase family 1 protein [Sulfidibacter corallicola]
MNTVMKKLNIGFFTLGTWGDIHFLLPLAEKLKSIGHGVKFCTSAMFEDGVAKKGMDFIAIPPDISKEEVTRLFMETEGEKPEKQAELALSGHLARDIEARFDRCMDIMKSCDFAICHPSDWAAQVAAEVSKKPWIQGYPAPVGIPNKKYVIMGAGPIKMGPLNGAVWKLMKWMFKQSAFKSIIAFGKDRGSTRSDLGFFSMSPYLNLLATSDNLIPFPEKPQHPTVLTGIWSLPKRDYRMSEEVAAFLDHEDAPAVVSFGSMGGDEAHGKEAAKIILEALEKHGMRTIIQRGWGNLSDANANGNVLFVDYIPHEHLFPHAAFVIHHGGAGVTTNATKAGVPQIVVPHGNDQFFWGDTVNKKGLGSKPVARTELNVANISERIGYILENKATLDRNAKEMAEKLNREDGLSQAVKAIDEFAEAHLA